MCEFIKALYSSFGLSAELHLLALYSSIILLSIISLVSEIVIFILYIVLDTYTQRMCNGHSMLLIYIMGTRILVKYTTKLNY